MGPENTYFPPWAIVHFATHSPSPRLSCALMTPRILKIGPPTGVTTDRGKQRAFERAKRAARTKAAAGGRIGLTAAMLVLLGCTVGSKGPRGHKQPDKSDHDGAGATESAGSTTPVAIAAGPGHSCVVRENGA